MDSLHALVVDDHPIFRKGLISLLQQDARIGKVTEAGDGSKALALLRQRTPDLSFLDLCMPGRDGLDVLAEFTRLRPRMKVNVINLSLTVFFDTASGIRGLGLFSCLSGTCVLGAQLLPHRPYAAITAMRGPVAKFPRKA